MARPHGPFRAATERRRRPHLLALVFGVLLALLGVTTLAQAVLVTVHFSATALDAAAGRDRSLVRLVVLPELLESDLDPAGLSPTRRERLRAVLIDVAARDDVQRLEIVAPEGTVLVSTDAARDGVPIGASESWTRAAGGQVGAEIRSPEATGPSPEAGDTMLIEYFPLTTPAGGVDGVVAVERDAAPILARLEATRRDILLVTVGAAAFLALLLVWIFRAAHVRLIRQTTELIEAEKRDALTGLYDHGTAVGLLAARLGTAMDGQREASAIRPDETPETPEATDAPEPLAVPDAEVTAAVALVDLDNFTLLNDTNGHDVGDRALIEVASLVAAAARPGMLVARYGPDEFLLAATDADAVVIESVVAAFRGRLAEIGLPIEGGDALPVTVSVGIARCPQDGTSPEDLLSAAAGALEEAKVGGGDAVRLARADTDTMESGRFDALKGLVIAIDSKDRYTKRHSEDVARYALFLADRIGVDEQLRKSIHLAGLLHDVGKIGIPEPILRKPAKLTAAERAIVEQHVVLGDMIVRDLPGIDIVRSGIRSHHERWDGQGYVDRLTGEEIPLIARILAVGDSFSAMTTSRPYRKALPIEEALRRIEDAAGTQLDEALVLAFIEGMRNAPDAPLPGTAEPPPTLWAPLRRVA
jgi:diguanylate cyclase (GGDEF)-like protein